MFGLDELYTDLLLEAKSPEEIKKILEYQFVQGKGVPQNILDAVFDMDKTKKKSYTKWVLMQWELYQKEILNAIKNNRLQKMFDYFQERAGSGLQLASMKSFPEALSMVPFNEDPIFKDLSDEEKELPENNYDIEYQTDEWIIVVPNTYEAELNIAQGCKWCTANAYGNGENFWNTYKKKGPLWINFDLRNGGEIAPMNKKEYPYKRYQFSFEASNVGEMKDINNDNIDFQELNIPEDVIEFYGSVNEIYKEKLEDHINNIDDDTLWERYDEERENACIYHFGNDMSEVSLLVLPQRNYDPVLEEDDSYFIYTSDDIIDPLIGSEMETENLVYKTYDGVPLVFLNSMHDGVIACVLQKGTIYRRFFWAPYRDVKILHESENVIIFRTEDSDDDIIIVSRDSSWISTEFDLYSMLHLDLSDNLTELKVIDLSSFGINDIYIQVSFGEWSSLIMVRKEDAHQEVIIKRAWQNDIFEVRRDEKGVYVQTQIRKYYLDINDNDNGLEPIEKIETKNGYLYVVSYLDEENNWEVHGLYDPEHQELILSDIAGYSIKNNLFIYNSPYNININYVYDIEKRKKYPIISNMLPHCGENGIVYYKDANGEKFSFYDTQNNRRIGWFKSCNLRDSKRWAIVSTDGKEKQVLDKTNGHLNSVKFKYIDIPFLSTPIGVVSNDEGSTFFLYNFINDEIVCDLKGHDSFCQLTKSSFVSERDPFLVKMSDGKCNLFNPYMGILNQKPFLLKNINYGTIIGEEDDKWFIYKFDVGNNLHKYPTQDGIDGKYVKSGEVDFTRAIFLVTNGTKDYAVTYFISQNKIEEMACIDGSEITEDDKNFITKLFFPQQSTISENFKSLIDRINNLY